MNRGFFLNNSPLTGLARRPGMALDEVNLFHYHPILLGKNSQDFAALALLLPGNNQNHVILPYMKLDGFHRKPLLTIPLIQSTSGAKEIIFINFFARNSRATGPKIRVPTGSFWGVIKTAELSSNLM